MLRSFPNEKAQQLHFQRSFLHSVQTDIAGLKPKGLRCYSSPFTEALRRVFGNTPAGDSSSTGLYSM